MKKVQALILILSLCAIAALGSESLNKKQLKISGYISDDAIKKFIGAPELWVYGTFDRRIAIEADVTPVIIKDNTFSVTLNLNKDFAYIRLRGPYINSLYLDLFLVEAGDSIVLDLKTDTSAFFTGRGAEKLNYQLFAGKMKGHNLKGFKAGDLAKINYFHNMVGDNLKLCQDSLGKIRPQLKEEIYDLLRVNTTSSINGAFLSVISTNEVINGNSLFHAAVLKEFTAIKMQLTGLAIDNPFIINNAYIYTQYLYDFEKAYLTVQTRKRKAEFSMLYNQIKSSYTGFLRDKLIALSFFYAARTPKILNYSEDALSVVRDSSVKELLKTFFDKKYPGAKAYNFSLVDPNGKRVTLQDLKGKVIIMDTWYNGCPGCVILAKRLAPIMHHYRNNEDVVLLSVNVDKEKQRFIAGIKTGLYGDKNSLFVYTGGNGGQDPLLLYYSYTSYPNVLIIDKKGDVLSANPPLLVDAASQKAFIELIDKAL